MAHLSCNGNIKANVNKRDLIKLKSIFIAKATISKVKGKASEYEKLIGNEATDQGLISKIYKQLIQLKPEKQTTQSKSGKKT